MRKVILLALGFIASGCAAQTFQNPRLLPTPHNVSTMLHGDLNGDGFDDIVYGDFATNPATLHVLLGDGRGGLAPGVTLTLPAYTPDNCKLARFTGSGSLDIACLVEPAGYGNSTLPLSIAVFPGRGDGTFSSPRTIDLSGQQYSQGILVVAGDLNGDGVPDMVVEQGGQGFPVLSDGHGRWVIGKTRNYYGVPIYTGDLNGDGQVDWIFSGPVVVLGNGDATFGAPQDYNPPNLAVQACAFGDLDGDGHVDAACGSATTISGNISGHWSIDFFHGNADGSFTPLPSHRMSFGDGSVSWEGYGSRAVPNYIVDLNGDGIPDLLGVSADGLTAYFGKGTYEFGSPVHFAAGNLTTLSGTASTNWILTDLNGDHLPDVVSGSFDGVLITLGKAGKGFDTASAYEVNGVAGYVAVADFNGDGVPDIVSTGDLHMAISLGRGDGSFLPYKNLDTGTVHWEGLYQHPDDNLLVHGDFNGDGKEDLFAVGSEVSGSFNENEYYLQGNGDGTFQSPVTVSQAPGLSYLYGLTVVADLNGDHRDDLIGNPDFQYRKNLRKHLAGWRKVQRAWQQRAAGVHRIQQWLLLPGTFSGRR